MRRIIALLLCLLLLGGCAVPAENGQTGQTQPNGAQPDYVTEFRPGGEGTGVSVSCMSFNVLSWDTHQTGFAEPSERAPLVVDYILEKNCDLVGLQEVSESDGYNWVKAMADGLSSVYNIRILTQEEDSAYTRMGIAAGLMILYRKDRFEFLDSGCYEFFEDSNRYYQWVKLKDRKSNREIYMTNTHFSIDPSWNPEYGDVQRLDEAKELADFWESTVQATPLFATGDYNCGEFEEPHLQELQAGIFQPSSSVAEEADGGSGVDFVYVNTLSMNCTRYVKDSNAWTTESGELLEMSDHCPVIAYAEYK